MNACLNVFYNYSNILLRISLNMGTGELSINKWEKKVTGVTYLKRRYLFEKATQIFSFKLKSNALLY